MADEKEVITEEEAQALADFFDAYSKLQDAMRRPLSDDSTAAGEIDK